MDINDPHEIVICIDCSASTKGNKKYWDRVLKIVEDNKDARFLIWSSRAKFVSYEKIKNISLNRLATGGTYPSIFTDLIKNHYKNIIIITDGQVSSSEVTRCDEMLEGMSFNHVRVIFIDTGGPINLSVAAPFTRNTEFVIENENDIIEGNSNIDLDFSAYKNNPLLFLKDYEVLLKAVTMKNIGRSNIELRNKILDFKAQLIKFITAKGEDHTPALLETLNNHNYEGSIKIAKHIYNSCYDSLIDDVNHSFENLINACDLSNNFSFSLIEPTRLTRAKEIEQLEIYQIESIESDGEFECPISYDDDAPCLLIREGESVLKFVEKKDLEMIITNPLIVLNMEDIKNRIKKRIDHILGFNTFKTLFDSRIHGDLVSPYSREKISCGIIFGNDKSHLKAFNYTLSQIFFGNKLVGLPVLWTYVLYKVLKEIEYINNNKQFIECFERFIIQRLKTSKTNITLSGLPIHPLIETTSDIAVWYCVVSPFIINFDDGKDDAKNRLRTFGNTSKYLIEMVDMLGYPFDKNKTLKLLSLYKAFSWMMYEEKKEGISTVIENQWLKKIKSHYQGVVILDDGYIVLVDGPITNPIELPDFRVYDDQEPLTLNELIYLAELVDAGKTVNSVIIDMDKAKDYPIPEYIISYGYDYAIDRNYGCKICPTTMRPYSVDRDKGRLWKDCAIEKFGIPIEKQVSCYARFIEYVESKMCYPTKIKFIKYLEKKERMKVDYPKNTLPRTILKIIDDVYESFEEVCGKNFSDVPVALFVQKSKKTYSLLKRIVTDGSSKMYPQIHLRLKRENEEKKREKKNRKRK